MCIRVCVRACACVYEKEEEDEEEEEEEGVMGKGHRWELK